LTKQNKTKQNNCESLETSCLLIWSSSMRVPLVQLLRLILKRLEVVISFICSLS